ncbi:MAG: hypothetical protein IIW13_04610, partial [Paludibacteraceae bacterium]|nr:hypothetical protein [Paludibacteraceae bacterium]
MEFVFFFLVLVDYSIVLSYFCGQFFLKKSKFWIMANILVIDDERSIRNTFKDIIEFENHT